MERIRKFIRKTRYSYRSLPDKKQYVEFFTAALTVPMLLTVIIINLNNLRTDKAATQTPTPTTDRPIVVNVPDNSKKLSPQPSNAACIRDIAPVSIGYPDEGDVITDSPLQITINYDQGDFCAAVWSYRINDGKFSDYDDKSIALYNVPNGTIRFQLRVKSIVTGKTETLTRTFTYRGQDTPTASGSAN